MNCLGKTIEELELERYKIPTFPKKNFTMCIPSVMKEFDQKHKSVILCGIECHVCVLQTALDLIEQGVQVHVVADAVTSRSQTDRHFGLMQMKHAGACLRTAESVILELIGGADHPKFKEIQKIIKVRSPDTELLTHML
uniref:Isochorismatase domain-containing protein 1 n=1 Tax=Syphacia muris TaxID=451379 RepID=A0A0N5AIH4_9BILA